MDILTSKERSERMALIRAKDTKIEMAVRRLIDRMGYSYQLHDPRLAGKPDLVFRKRHKLIFIHGCFWHGHQGCRKARLPKSRCSYWLPKISGNAQRDKKYLRKLRREGWSVLVVWECQLPKAGTLAGRIKRFLRRRKLSEKASF